MNMRDTIYCNICKNETHQFLFALPDVETNEIFSIYQCNHCRLESTSPRPHHLEKYYPNTYYGKRHGLTARYCVKRRIRWLNKISEGKKGKLLDIGCGDGAFLLQAKKEGLLAPHGLLLIAVPNAAGWQARLFGPRWLHRDVPRHLFHFNPHSRNNGGIL